jgi:hypothetical protein
MKPLLLTLLLSLSLAGFGQDTTKFKNSPPDHHSLSGFADYDTVAVWIEYTDTSKPISYNMTQSGYEVTKTHWVPEVWKTEQNGDALIYYEAHWQTDHVAYLDHFKKPLNRLVWGVKEKGEK